jgi:hypothetical protein
MRAILLLLIVGVLAVTGLNHYTTSTNLAYFHDASQYETIRLCYIKAVENQQARMHIANVLLEAMFKDREEAREVAMRYVDKYRNASCAIQSQSAYIKELEEALKANGIEIHAPKLAPPKPDKQTTDRSTNLQVQVAKSLLPV